MQASPTSHFSPGPAVGTMIVFSQNNSQKSWGEWGGAGQGRAIPLHKRVHPNDLARSAEIASGFGAHIKCQTRDGL